MDFEEYIPGFLQGVTRVCVSYPFDYVRIFLQINSKDKVSSIFKTDNYTKCRVPLFLNPVAAGFPAPTEDYIEGKIDLNRHLVKHPDSTFLVRVVGESMRDAGIHPRDLLVVDRSLEAISGKVVIAVVDGELTVKRLRKHRNKLWLMPENPNFQPIEIGENMELHIWGVVTNVIHAL